MTVDPKVEHGCLTLTKYTIPCDHKLGQINAKSITTENNKSNDKTFGAVYIKTYRAGCSIKCGSLIVFKKTVSVISCEYHCYEQNRLLTKIPPARIVIVLPLNNGIVTVIIVNKV